MADFAGVINQLKINNEEEKQRDSNLNKNIAFSRDALQDGFKQLSGQTVQSNNKTNQAIKDASTKQVNATKSFGDDQKKEIVKSRKEANLKNKELQSLTGKNTKLMREQEKEDAQFRKELIDVELQNPDLNPTKRKELEKERKRLEGNVLKDAFRGLKDAFTDFAGPLKNFLGAKTGIPGITVGRFALLA